VAIRCRLAPLRSDEVALYIKSRLQTVGYEGKELFDPGSVEQIARYSQGIPRLINVICDNALLITYATSKSRVSAKIIEEVARDLQLVGRSQVSATEQRKRVSSPANDDVGWRDDAEQFARPSTHQRQPRRSWAGVGIGVVLMIVILAGTVLYSHQSGSLAALGVNLEELVGVSWKNPLQAQTKLIQNTRREKSPLEERVSEAPLLEESKLSTSDSDRGPAVDPRMESSMNSNLAEAKDEKASSGTASDQTRTAKTRPEIETFFYYSNDGAAGVEKLEFEIYKAIHNRAIRGVEVSVRDGTVYLTGQVATEKQKLAAAQAARSVPGVKDVRDQIAVNSFYYR